MAGSTNRLTGWLLAVSLCLNFLILGSVAGFFLAGWHKAPQLEQTTRPSGTPRGQGGPPLLRPVLQEIERSEARALLRNIRDLQQAEGLTRDSQKILRTNLAQVIAADPFDPAALSALLGDLRSEMAQRAGLSHTALVDAVAQMDAQTRQRIADRMLAPRGGGGRGRD